MQQHFIDFLMLWVILVKNDFFKIAIEVISRVFFALKLGDDEVRNFEFL